MKVALLKGQSQYGVLRLMIDELATAFRRRGWDVTIADLEAMQGVTVDDLAGRLTSSGPLDLIFSFNFGGNFVGSDGRSMIALTQAPHEVQLVDYPLQDLRRLMAITPSTALLLVDPTHVRVITELMGPDRFAFVGFGPHGAIGSPKQLPGRWQSFVDQRSVPILFAGSYYRANETVWQAYPPLVRTVFMAAVEIATSASWVSPLKALDMSLSAHGLDPNGEGIPGLRREDVIGVRMLAGQIQDWIRTHQRDAFFQAAARAGLPLTVVGKDYDEIAGKYDNIDYRGPVSVAEAVRLMQNSRLVLNLNANFSQGSHERPLSAMVAGAAVASDFSTFYAEAFQEKREIALFRWNALDDELARLGELASDPSRLFEMARAGQAKAVAQHRWDNRIETIVVAGKIAGEVSRLPNDLAQAPYAAA